MARRPAGLVIFLMAACGCSSVPPATPSRVEASSTPPAPVSTPTPALNKGRLIRTSGVVQAAKALSVRVPQLAAQQSRLTLARLVPNGTRVRQGDPLVEFDKTGLLDEQREAIGKLGDIEHQVSERRARARSDATKRMAQIREAEADLAKAGIQLQKGPVLNQIERRKNEVKADSARARVASLEKSHKFHELEEAAAVAVLQRKFERQQVMLERIQRNLERLDIRAPHDGMIALENTWRSGSMGPPQEGDQVYPGQPLLRIFDPSSMVVDAPVNESDFGALAANAPAKVYLDAYPGAAFDGVLESASPVATAALESPVRSFAARFRVNATDARLLPDLSASLEVRLGGGGGPSR